MASDLILTLNAGSSSVKFALFDVNHSDMPMIASGQVEGLPDHPRLQARLVGASSPTQRDLAGGGEANHAMALQAILGWVGDHLVGSRIMAVGHRVVHGGPDHRSPALVDERLLEDLRKLVPLAPLHQPHNLSGVEAARRAFPHAPQVACFDTAFHRGHAFAVDSFALPRELYESGVRRYGFHGLSYEYVARRIRDLAPVEATGNVIVAHLGNGASLCALRDGKSVGTSMGFTALDGLIMGTRCGQIDPGVLLYLLTERGLDAAALSDLLYHRSGLKGLSGLSGDMRELEASGSPAARDAIDCFVLRICREVASLAAVLQGMDMIVFTGGIGENSAAIRREVLQRLGWMGVTLSDAANERGETTISAVSSPVRALVVRTSEERMIAEHTLRTAGLRTAGRAA
jgi:acetate kinase